MHTPCAWRSRRRVSPSSRPTCRSCRRFRCPSTTTPGARCSDSSTHWRTPTTSRTSGPTSTFRTRCSKQSPAETSPRRSVVHDAQLRHNGHPAVVVVETEQLDETRLVEGQHRFYRHGVELRARAGTHLLDGFLEWHPGPIGPVADHRVHRVRDREQARAQRNLRASQATGVSLTVPTLVV